MRLGSSHSTVIFLYLLHSTEPEFSAATWHFWALKLSIWFFLNFLSALVGKKQWWGMGLLQLPQMIQIKADLQGNFLLLLFLFTSILVPQVTSSWLLLSWTLSFHWCHQKFFHWYYSSSLWGNSKSVLGEQVIFTILHINWNFVNVSRCLLFVWPGVQLMQTFFPLCLLLAFFSLNLWYFLLYLFGQRLSYWAEWENIWMVQGYVHLS